MTIEWERRVKEFVDRGTELSRFCEMLETGRKRIMVVWGDGGLGKTSLLARMSHECAQRTLRKIELVWSDTRLYDYLAIMRKIRDDVGVHYFEPFTDRINYFTVPQYKLKIIVEGQITVAEGAEFDNSTVGDIGGVIVKDSMFVVPRSDQAIPETERMRQLTDRFIPNLATATEKDLCVIFFDAVEKMTRETEQWVWSELVPAIAEGRLPHIRLVLCGRNKPQLNRYLQKSVEETELRPLGLADIKEYLAKPHIIEHLSKRGIDFNERERTLIATTLLAATDGHPLEIALRVDTLLRMWENEALSDG